MTKSRDNKQAIRAYMRTHGVNYTTAKRALATQKIFNDILTEARQNPHKMTPIITTQRPSDLNAHCVCAPDEMHAGHRTDCPERIKLMHAALDADATGQPVVLDPDRTRAVDLFTLPHIHNLAGECIKNRGGNFCTPPKDDAPPASPPASPRVAIGVDPDPDYLHTVVHTLNGPVLTGGLGTGEPVTPSDADRLRATARATTEETKQNVIPEGATVRRWQQTGLDPETGERVPTVITEVRHLADETGQIKVTTHTDFNTRLDHTGRLTRSQRALDVLADGPVPTPSRRDDLKAALRTGNHDILKAHLRTHAPGPHTDDLHAALEQLASLELELREHTNDPETPVTYEMLRHAILTTTTHGQRWGGSHGFPTAADVCRSYLLATPVTTSENTPHLDGQHPVHPADLAAILETLADDDTTLDEAAHGTAATPDDIAEELLILANTLDGTLPTTTPDSNGDSDDHHYLTVTDGTRGVDRRYTIDCTTPTTGRGSCEGWEECPDCTYLGTDQWDTILDQGEAHGLEHIMLTNGPGIPTGKCALIAFPEAWEESDAILSLPPGRYAIHHKWEDEHCTLTLRTH